MPESRRSILQLLAELPSLIGDLLRAELKAFTDDLKLRAARAGVGAALVVVALVLLCLALTALVVAAIAALALVLPWWASALIVAGALIVVAAILVRVAVGRFRAAKPDIQARVDSIKGDVQLLQGLRKPTAEGERE